MSETIALEFIKNNTAFLNQMYDIVRVVDPLEKKVIDLQENRVIVTNDNCFGYWNKGAICENCISSRALMQDKSFFKLEQKDDSIMMVTVLPILDGGGKTLVLELLKNVTDSMIIGSDMTPGQDLIRNLLMNINDLVVKDQLTSLYNRHFVTDRLPADIIRGRHDEFPISLLFIDLDNLKSINDLYGHFGGDLAIKSVSKTILGCIRSDKDWAARYGGDEFIVCLNNTSAESAYLVAERIRTRIGQTPIMDAKICITVSIGVYTSVNSTQTAEKIIELADRRMYEAKKKGKNFTVQVAG